MKLLVGYDIAPLVLLVLLFNSFFRGSLPHRVWESWAINYFIKCFRVALRSVSRTARPFLLKWCISYRMLLERSFGMGKCYCIAVKLSTCLHLIFFIEVADLQNTHPVYYLEFALGETSYFFHIRWLYDCTGFFSFYFQVNTAWANVGCGSICYLIYRTVTPAVGCLKHIDTALEFVG